MSDSEGEGLLPEEKLLKRHRKERKDLQGKIQALKKAASKGDKKKKKEAMEEIAKLEEDLSQRQEAELRELKSSQQTPLVVEDAVNELGKSLEASSIHKSEDQCKEHVSKAQKRRDKKAQKEKDRQIDIEKQEEENKLGMRHIEAEKLKSILTNRKLTTHDITSDGDCLYNSVAHQLKVIADVSKTVQELRSGAAEILRRNVNQFLPFLTNHKTGEPLSQQEFESYCRDLVEKPVWGGQIELKALSQSLQNPIEVIQAEGPPLIIGEEFGSKKPLIVTYHRHYYGLGEHYNSTLPINS